jgi:hypothetical protein
MIRPRTPGAWASYSGVTFQEALQSGVDLTHGGEIAHGGTEAGVPQEGVEDVSVPTIALPVMAPAMASALADGLGAIYAWAVANAATTGAAVTGATIIGQVPDNMQLIVRFFNATPTASNFILDFSEGLPSATVSAQRAFIYQFVANYLISVQAAGLCPPGMSPENFQLLIDQVKTTASFLQNFGSAPTSPQSNVVAIDPGPVDLTSANNIASASIEGGGEADSGGATGGN